MRLNANFLASCLLLLGCTSGPTPSSSSATTPISLEPLQEAEQSEGCGCSFSLRPQDTRDVPEVFALDLESDKALVRVNGSLFRLTKLESKEHDKRPGRHTIGDRYREIWASEGIRVVLEYQTTFACPDDDPACEVTMFQGSMVIRVGEADARFKVWGNCGC